MTDESDSSRKPSAQEPESGDEHTAGDVFNLPGDYRGANIYIKSTIYGSTGNNVRLQNLRDFTVQIRSAESETILGTGMIVSPDGKVVTCAHILRAAGVDPRVLNGEELSVYFPQAFAGDKKDRRAKVIAFFPDFDDDVVLLQLTDGSAPLGPERMPVLGTAENSQGNGFRSYGYRGLEDYIAGWAHGTIQGHVEAPPKRKVQAEPVQLESNQINRGMSGSAVLDIERNLVVGIISETWFPDKSGKDSDTGWAVDSRVLSLAPLGLPVQDAPYPYKPAPEPKTDEETKQRIVEATQSTVAERRIGPDISWNNAPAILHEWTGRNHLLMRLTEDWNNPKKRVTGLIGFGGEGKSSLARKWVADVIASTEGAKQSPRESETLAPHASAGVASGSALATTLDGVFWWGFYENRSVDEFLESALNYLSGGRIDPRAVPSSSLRAQLIAAMLGTGRYLFVLDGLEVMQHQQGDQYGLLQSTDLRDVLTFFARPDNRSFCLITSRAPVLDLIDYTTYTHRDVERLSEDDGRTLLRVLGVKGSDAELNRVVADWGGHALTLSILAAYLVDRYHGDIKHLADIPVPTADEPRYERVHRLLRRYDEHLTEDEREFQKLFSLFRLPVHEGAFEKVFRMLLPPPIGYKSVDMPRKARGRFLFPFSKRKPIEFQVLSNPSNRELLNLVKRLINYRLLRFNFTEHTYATHPLIRNHYLSLFNKNDSSQVKTTHQQIKDYYLSLAGDDDKEHPTLDDLKPLIEAVHHACQAGAYDEAFKGIYFDRIQQKGLMVFQLGAYDLDLNVLLEFFPKNDMSKEPLVNDLADKLWILNELGYCLMNLGRLREAELFYEQYVGGSVEAQDWWKTSIGYRNLAALYEHLGLLWQSTEAAKQALSYAHRATNKWEQKQDLASWAWAEHLCGNIKIASDYFMQAETLEGEIDSSTTYLCFEEGTRHANHLLRTGQSDYARRVTDANLLVLERHHLTFQISQCYRILADLDSDSSHHLSARRNYESALKTARTISMRPAIIEALLARGRWQAKHMKDANAAFSDLNEALGYCVESGYRIYEADVRVALAWAYLANLTPGPSLRSAAQSPERRGENLRKVQQSAERALQMSNEMGYYWGKMDAEEVLERIKAEG